MKAKSYDIIAVGSGFSTSFFLHRFLQRHRGSVRVLVLEAGKRITHPEQLEMRRSVGSPRSFSSISSQFFNKTPDKTWAFFTGFGGGSNCWVACTPRLLPEDFKLHTTYGVGADWPLDYDDLEPYYCDAEELMQISGDSERSPYPRSRPYPQAPHRMTEPVRRLMQAFPGKFFSHPCARSPMPVPGQRGPCCNNGVCTLCPVDAKFTILNGMRAVYDDTRVELETGAKVEALTEQAGTITGVKYLKDGTRMEARADLVVLGANGLFNPYILLKSGMDHPEIGRGLCEQVSRSVTIDLDGIDNYQGSTVSAALGYMYYSGDFRKHKAAAMIQTSERLNLRNERGRWLQRMRLNFVYEDHRLPENRVEIYPDDPSLPMTTHVRRSSQTEAGLASMEEDVQAILDAIPNQGCEFGKPWRTDSHIMGTTVMGTDRESSLVDSHCLHHDYRNLLILGSGTFPTAAPANPTLTLSALALRSADKLAG